MEDLLRKAVIKPVPKDQERSRFYSTYFLVPKLDRGHRPILNLKFFNFIVHKTSFRMETLRSVVAVMRTRQWMASVDLKDAYFHIRVVPAHRQYLRFRWLPEVRTGPEAQSQALGSFPSRPLPPLGLPLDWHVWPVAGLDTVEDLRSDLGVRSGVSFLSLEDDLLGQPELGRWFPLRKGTGNPSFPLAAFSPLRGSEFMQPSLHQSVCRGCSP